MKNFEVERRIGAELWSPTMGSLFNLLSLCEEFCSDSVAEGGGVPLQITHGIDELLSNAAEGTPVSKVRSER